MANKLTYGTSVEVNTIAADWDWGVSGDTDDPKPKLAYLMFVPGANADEVFIRDGTKTGPIIMQALCPDLDEKIKYFHGGRKRPFIDEAISTLSVGHKVLVGLWPSKRN